VQHNRRIEALLHELVEDEHPDQVRRDALDGGWDRDDGWDSHDNVGGNWDPRGDLVSGNYAENGWDQQQHDFGKLHENEAPDKHDADAGHLQDLRQLHIPESQADGERHENPLVMVTDQAYI
jgi:hypothetical protein